MKNKHLFIGAVILFMFSSCTSQKGCFTNVAKGSYKIKYRPAKPIKYPTKIMFGVYKK